MKLSYAHGVSTQPLIGQTIGDWLDEIAARFVQNEALVSVFEQRRFTYAEFRDEVARCSRGLMALGVQKGDRVGIWSTNCIAWVLTQFSTARIGAVLVNINPAFRTYELEFTLRQSECNVLVSGEGFKDNDYLQTLQTLIPELSAADPREDLHSENFPHLRRIVYLGSQPPASVENPKGIPSSSPGLKPTSWPVLCSSIPRSPSRRDYPGLAAKTSATLKGLHQSAPNKAPPPGILAWNEMLANAVRIPLEDLAARQSSLDFDDVINIQYTSGTTGSPKAAMLTHHNILNNGYWIGERMRLTERDRLCIPVPFYHCFGMVLGNLACVTHGATMVLPAPHFSPVHTLQTVAEERCTALHGVPTMFIAELEHPRFREFDLSSLRTGIMAGAPCPIEVMKRVISEMHCREITIACGMTETSPVCNMTEVDDPIELRVGTVGKVMPHQEEKVIDPGTGCILPCGEHGELCYRGYHVMRGYYHNNEVTEEMIDPAGWLHSGDLAMMDEEGYVRITGRLKDMICRGGEKIFPRELEEFLFTHPKIAEAYAIGVPDSYYGEQVMVWAKLKPGQTMTAEELQSFCHDQIMDYKIPRYVKFVEDLPKTVTGKVQKYRMREISAEELGLSELQKKAA